MNIDIYCYADGQSLKITSSDDSHVVIKLTTNTTDYNVRIEDVKHTETVSEISIGQNLIRQLHLSLSKILY